MCNPTVPSVTLQTAILMQVKEFADSNKTFSAHDITKSIRDKCNTGKLEVPEVEDLSGNDSFRFNVDHDKVRNLFREMCNNGVFSSDYNLTNKFNGMFYEYTAVPATQNTTVPTLPPVPSTGGTPPPTSSLPKVNFNKLTPAEIQNRVASYLGNCSVRVFRPSIKNIQSAIKRGSQSTGVTSEEIEDIVTNVLGYKLSIGGTRKETQVLV